MGSLVQISLLLCLTLQACVADVEKGNNDGNPLVTTKYGDLQGKILKAEGTEKGVHAFLGIPFAKPPVGQLRFSAPQPAEPWNSVREASEQPPVCLQDEKTLDLIKEYLRVEIELPPVSEDCLFLNVYTPADRKKESKLPVMAFIHGGGLTMGGAFMFPGTALSAHENVVIVVLQYRLGVLGFFSTGVADAPGNFGMLDQVAALQWVQENIEDFGGDPQSVTIFGESAGGLSVSALVLSPLSKGLFHKAISESGVALMPGLVVSKPENLVFVRNHIANISGCESPEAAVVLDCLKKKTEEEMVEITASMKLPVIPACVDGVFLPKSAEEILVSKESNRVPFMIGVTNHECGYLLPKAMNITGFEEGMDKDTVLTVVQTMPLMGSIGEFLPLIMDEYFGDTNDPHEIRNRFLDLCGDFVFVIPALRTAKYHRDSDLPVYFYEFQHRPSMFDDLKPDFVKADHGDELLFVMGAPFLGKDAFFNGRTTDKEKVLSKTVMKYWANFARHGNPNGPGLAEWPKYDDDEDYLEINLKIQSAKKLKEKRFEFWTETLPREVRKIAEGTAERTEL